MSNTLTLQFLCLFFFFVFLIFYLFIYIYILNKSFCIFVGGARAIMGVTILIVPTIMIAMAMDLQIYKELLMSITVTKGKCNGKRM